MWTKFCTSLTEAREKARAWHKLINKGIDPREQAKAEQAAAEQAKADAEAADIAAREGVFSTVGERHSLPGLTLRNSGARPR